MEPEKVNLVVTNNQSDSRFEADIGGKIAILTYRRLGKSLVIDHTEAPPDLQGRGIASKLANAALEFARSQHLEVVPVCPYVTAYLREHPEYQDVVSAKNLKRLLDEN